MVNLWLYELHVHVHVQYMSVHNLIMCALSYTDSYSLYNHSLGN